MMELPEATVLAGQMNERLSGRRILAAEREDCPQKWGFYNRPREEYEQLLPDRKTNRARADGSHVGLDLDSGFALQLGDVGERILLHDASVQPPEKCHLLLRFEDDSFLGGTCYVCPGCQPAGSGG